MRRLGLVLLVTLALAAPAAAAPPFKATLTALTHAPKVNAKWTYVVRVTDLGGRPIPAKIHLQILFQGVPVGQVGVHTVKKGVWRETIQWPPESKGQPLVFQAIVTVAGATRKLAYPIAVQ